MEAVLQELCVVVLSVAAVVVQASGGPSYFHGFLLHVPLLPDGKPFPFQSLSLLEHISPAGHLAGDHTPGVSLADIPSAPVVSILA